jgi:hypothetical protein
MGVTCASFSLFGKIPESIDMFIIFVIGDKSDILPSFINLTDFINTCCFFIPSPTKLGGDIVTLPSVRHNPCEHSRINILQWILTKLGTYLVLKKIWNPIDFQGQRSRSQGQIFTA